MARESAPWDCNATNYCYADAAHVPAFLNFDRILVMGGDGHSSNTVCATNGINLQVRDTGTVTNSFITDIMSDYMETHGIASNPQGVNVTLYNNYISAESISGFLTSGGGADFLNPIYSNWTVTYNYFTKPIKLWGGSSMGNCGRSCGNEVVTNTGDTLIAPMAPADTTLDVNIGNAVSLPGVFVIDSERIKVCSVADLGNYNLRYTVCPGGRGYLLANGSATPPASHAGGTAVNWINPTPNYHGTIATALGRPEDDWVTGFGVNRNGLFKNLMEFKSIDGAYVAYNVSEFNPGAWQGQQYGATITPRSSGVYIWPGCVDTNNTPVTLTTTAGATSFSWTGIMQWSGDCKPGQRGSGIHLKPGNTICSASALPGKTLGSSVPLLDCRKVVSVDIPGDRKCTSPGTCTGTVDAAWSLGVSQAVWWEAYMDEGWYRNVVFESNVFRNTVTTWQNLARVPVSSTSLAQGAGRIKNLVVRNNLAYNNIPMHTDIQGMSHLASQEKAFTDETQIGADGYVFVNNTHDLPNLPLCSLCFSLGNWDVSGGAYVAKFKGFRAENNIFPWSDSGIAIDGGYGRPDWAFQYALDSDAVFRNNQTGNNTRTMSPATTCRAGQTCVFPSALQKPYDRSQYIDAAHGNFKIKPGSAWSKAGTDGKDIGVDYDRLPLVKNAHAVSGGREATLEYDLSATNLNIPQVLEVSATTEVLKKAGGGTQSYPCLASTLCRYVVVPSLDPTLFKQPDSSERTNPKLPPVAHDALHRSWPICWNQTVADDRDGTNRDMSCQPNTTYYYRLMAGGDTITGSFKTGPIALAASRIVRRMNPPQGTSAVRLNYGSTPAVVSHIDAAPGSDGEVSIDVPRSDPLFTQVVYLTAGTPTFTGPVTLSVVE